MLLDDDDGDIGGGGFIDNCTYDTAGGFLSSSSSFASVSVGSFAAVVAVDCWTCFRFNFADEEDLRQPFGTLVTTWRCEVGEQ